MIAKEDEDNSYDNDKDNISFLATGIDFFVDMILYFFLSFDFMFGVT